MVVLDPVQRRLALLWGALLLVLDPEGAAAAAGPALGSPAAGPGPGAAAAAGPALGSPAAGPGPDVKLMVTEMSKILKPMNKMLFRLVFTPKSLSSNSSTFRPTALQYYTGSTAPTTIVCAVSGHCLPARDVHAGHIFQQRWRSQLQGNLGFRINDPWNILLMHKNVEKGFDNFEITILPVHHKVILLRKDLWDKVVFEYTKEDGITAAGGNDSGQHGSRSAKVAVTWGDLHDRELSITGANQPSDMALGIHARAAYTYALDSGWCTKSQLPALDYGSCEMLHRFLADVASSSSDGGLTSVSSGSSDSGLGGGPAT
ncbi:hypothetical protein Vretimale_4423 [Volvox reticuliferus]|nr:hypothetical protein Vretimale_4423 [Volvox reticuliferus]